MLFYEKGHIQLSLDPATLALEVGDTREDSCYRTEPAAGFQALEASCREDGIAFSFLPAGIGEPVQALYTVEEGEPPCAKLILSSRITGSQTISYPPPIAPVAGDTALYPYGEGVAFEVDDPETLIPARQSLCGCGDSSMSFWGLLGSGRTGRWLLVAVETNADAELVHRQGEDGLWRTSVEWLLEKGCWSYDRVLRFCPGREGGITALCGAYRLLAARRGFRVSLADKAASVPAAARLPFCADVWLWNDDAMDKLYDPAKPYAVPTPAQLARRREIARDMRENGMEHVLWSVFDESVDKETVEFVKSLGFLTTIYDIYTDVIPTPSLSLIPETRRVRCAPRQELWPDGVVKTREGDFQNAWQLRGTDGAFHSQNRICDEAGYHRAREVIPCHAAETGIQGRFLDVLMTSAHECFHPKHPQTRTGSMHWQREQLRLVGELGLVCGTEIGREDGAAYAHYNEGMLSPPLYRAPDAGRRMTHLYDDPAQADAYQRYMLNPPCRVPLWELIYHDCVVSYWYWGDSTNCCPALTERRDLFCMLYGLPPLYSFRAADWERLKPVILASYRRTAAVTALTGGSPMVAFDYPAGHFMIQRTGFGNGVSVMANFSTTAYESCDRGLIEPGTAVVLKPDGSICRPK